MGSWHLRLIGVYVFMAQRFQTLQAWELLILVYLYYLHRLVSLSQYGTM